MNTSKEHFDSVAKEYNSKRRSSLLGKLIAKEKTVVLALLNPQPREEILDAGCGAGDYAEILKKKGAKVYGVDIAQNMIQELRKKGIPGSVQDLETMDLKKKFDKIVSIGALEFCSHPEKVIENLKKHLKTNGYMVVLFPRLSPLGVLYWFYHKPHKINIKLLRVSKLRKAVENMNLKITTLMRADPTFCFYVMKLQKGN